MPLPVDPAPGLRSQARSFDSIQGRHCSRRRIRLCASEAWICCSTQHGSAAAFSPRRSERRRFHTTCAQRSTRCVATTGHDGLVDLRVLIRLAAAFESRMPNHSRRASKRRRLFDTQDLPGALPGPRTFTSPIPGWSSGRMPVFEAVRRTFESCTRN